MAGPQLIPVGVVLADVVMLVAGAGLTRQGPGKLPGHVNAGGVQRNAGYRILVIVTAVELVGPLLVTVPVVFAHKRVSQTEEGRVLGFTDAFVRKYDGN